MNLPEPSPEARAHSTRVAAHIRSEIEAAGGWLSFARYMELALYAPGLEDSFRWLVDRLARRNSPAGRSATLLKVFLPYIVWNTVFDNTRVVSETGLAPAPFSEYSYPLLQFSRDHHFRYPYQEWPRAARESAG